MTRDNRLIIKIRIEQDKKKNLPKHSPLEKRHLKISFIYVKKIHNDKNINSENQS